jgi:tetratricopeptide (TPR) repeat protein
MATLSVEGPEAALAAVEAARAALHQATPEEGREQALAWEHLVLTEQAARVLVAIPRLDEALASLEGLDPAYADLGDLQSVGDVVVLRAEILIGLDRAEEALASMTEHAQQAVDAGNAQGARRFGGELARMLDDLGRPEEAETAWQRYSALSEAG